MSLVAQAIRTCLRRALFDTTLAGTRVHDSSVQPVEEMIDGDPQPFIVVSTGDEALKLQGWQALDAGREMTIIIEIAVGGLVQYEVPEEQGGGQGLRLDVPQTDAGLETNLNLIGRQVWREILVGGPWSDLLREFAFWPKSVTVLRGGGAEQGLRYAARQYTITTDTLAEPDFGAEPERPFSTLIAMMEAEDDMREDARLMRSLIIGQALPDWRRDQVGAGLTNASYLALGLGPLFRPAGEPPAQRFSLTRAGRIPSVIEASP